MATRTFIGDGASHNWSATGAWVEGIVPTAADDVVFSSNTAGSILVIDGTSGSPSLCKSIDTTNYTRTITFGGSSQINVGGSTSGAFKLTAGMTFAPASGSIIKFVSTTTGNNITWAGYLMTNLVFDGVGGGWTFQDDLTCASNNANTLTLTNGSLNCNSKNVAPSARMGFSSNNSNTRSLTLGTGTWQLSTVTSPQWDIGTSTGMTLSAASSTITSGITTSTGTFAGGGLTYGTLSCTTITTGVITITGANTFGTLTCTLASGVPTTTSSMISLSANQTITGTFTASGFSLIDRLFILSDTGGTARTISAGTFAITNCDLRDITKAGAGSGDISATSSTTGNGDCGGNSGWTFQGARNVYMKTAVSVGWSAANWFTTSGGSTAAVPPLPLVHDTAIFDANSVTAASKSITVNMPRIAGSTWTGVANTPTFAASLAYEIYGSVIFVSGMTLSADSVAVAFKGRGSTTFNSGTLSWPNNKPITIDLVTGTLTQAANFTVSGASSGITVTSGTWNGGGFTIADSGNFSITGGAFTNWGTATIGGTYTQSGGTVTLGGTTTLSGALALSAGTLNMNGYQITGHTTATISSTGTLNLSGQLNGSGAFSITGGTITDSGASGELKGTTMSFSGGTSAIRKMTASSTFAISSTAALTFNPGVSTWVTSFNETGTTHSLTYNGTSTNINGTLTVTTASGSGGAFTFGS